MHSDVATKKLQVHTICVSLTREKKVWRHAFPDADKLTDRI